MPDREDYTKEYGRTHYADDTVTLDIYLRVIQNVIYTEAREMKEKRRTDANRLRTQFKGDRQYYIILYYYKLILLL